MPIIDNDKLDRALASKDKDAIKAALADISTGTLSREEKAALNLSKLETYLDVANAFGDQYNAFLKETLAILNKTNKAVGKAEDKEKIEAIKKSI